jgi:hypothetical protein
MAMTHIITIETQSESQFAQIKGLAERLGVRIKESHKNDLSEAEALQLLDRVAGSWDADGNSELRTPADQKELFKNMEELRLSLRHIKVDPNIDLSALANDVNDTPL